VFSVPTRAARARTFRKWDFPTSRAWVVVPPGAGARADPDASVSVTITFAENSCDAIFLRRFFSIFRFLFIGLVFYATRASFIPDGKPRTCSRRSNSDGAGTARELVFFSPSRSFFDFDWVGSGRRSRVHVIRVKSSRGLSVTIYFFSSEWNSFRRRYKNRKKIFFVASRHFFLETGRARALSRGADPPDCPHRFSWVSLRMRVMFPLRQISSTGPNVPSYFC